MNFITNNQIKIILWFLSIIIFLFLEFFVRIFPIFEIWPIQNDFFKISLNNITLQQVEIPNFLEPFQKITYYYSWLDSNEIVIIDQQNNIFSSDQSIILWNPDIYKEEHDIFWYENVWKMYPNIYFFLLQYFLLLFAIIMFLKSHKNSNQLKLNFW